ncbi:BMP family protein [Cryobacterium sp. Hh7]|uniref:BMP family lipoprotein n=1 Tax=Cryobacterium sp. Hh7 TaxID=1259159 RepID=UPI00141BB2E8|nr:BMP family ABC transporter substrate-binding protein [Cryobacterium sp. Hh7]
MNVLIRKRQFAGIAALGAAGLVLAGCATAPEATDATNDATETDFLACAVSDEGSWNDKSFNEAAFDGLLKAESDLGVTLSDAESHSIEDFEPNLAAMVGANCDLTFAVGFNLVAPVNAAAAANPDVNFVTIDGWSEGNANLKAVEYAMDESSYLAGYLAAAQSTTKVVGTYGGLNIPAVTVFMAGFHNGAKAYEAETGTPVTVLGYDPASPDTGDFVGNFEDSAKAKSLSAGQLEKGADIIFPVAGSLFSATSEAINESGKAALFIGVDKDIAVTSPEYASQILTSVEKKMTDAVYDVIKSTMEDGFNGEAYLGTLENGGTVLSSFYEFESSISPVVIERLEEIKAGIIDGSIDPQA